MEVKKMQENEKIKTICTYCKRVLKGPQTLDCQDEDVAQLSHGICPDCLLEHYPDEYLAIQEA